MNNSKIDIRGIVEDSEDEILAFINTRDKFRDIIKKHFSNKGFLRHELEEVLIALEQDSSLFEKYLDMVFGINDYVSEKDFDRLTLHAISILIKNNERFS